MERKFLLDICDAYQPQTIAAKSLKGGQYPVYGANGVIGYHTAYNHKSPELVMGCRGSCGAMHITAPFSWINGNAMVIHPKEGVNLSRKYLYYSILSEDLHDIITGTANPQITQTNLRKLRISICDCFEQARIVARIEELFSQLDAGAETLKKTKAQLAVYRQAVLKEAFEGQLTGVATQSVARLGEFIETPRYGTSKKCDYESGVEKTAVYRIPNIDHTDGRISHDDIKYAQFTDNEIKGIRLQQGDILIIRSNGSVSLVGRAAMIYAADTCGTFAGYLMRLRIKDQGVLVPKYLLLYLQSHQARIYIENKAKSTSGVHNINSTEISDRKDQLAIIGAIESRLSVCDSIDHTVDATLQQAEAMRQSILKDAFEGRL